MHANSHDPYTTWLMPLNETFFKNSISLLLIEKCSRNYPIWQISTFNNTCSECIPWPLLFVFLWLCLLVYTALLSLIFNFVMCLHRANMSPLCFSSKRVRKPSVPLVFPVKHCPNLWSNWLLPHLLVPHRGWLLLNMNDQNCEGVIKRKFCNYFV